MKKLLITIFCILLLACEEPQPIAVGLLESDRIELVAEVSEPINSIQVIEGQSVKQGDLLLSQDRSRVEARIADATAFIARLDAQLAEQIAGPRQETIEAAEAAVEAARVEVAINEIELDRLQRLGAAVATQERIDLASSQLDASRANLNQASARLRELQAGTRQEAIEQTRQQLVSANAQLELIRIDEKRLNTYAPVGGIVDSLPFENGERPAMGAVVAVLLAGEQPHARVYVPESLRVNVRPGSMVTVYVDGIETPIQGTVRRIASEATFTPYFSLTEFDRGRLSYLAEITLETVIARLPDGVPVEVSF